MFKTDYVNTEIGTENNPEFSHGNIYPIAAVPHGMTFFSVQNSGNSCWFFNPRSEYFEGIRLTHMPSPWVGDYGNFLITVFGGEIGDNRRSYGIRAKRKITPYGITVSTDICDMELAPTNSGCALKLDFKGADNVLFLRGRGLTVGKLGDKCASGCSHTCDHAKSFELKEHIFLEADCDFEVETLAFGYALHFAESRVCVKLATSFIGIEQAKLNFARELKNADITRLSAACKGEWEDYLSKIEIDADEGVKRTFYSCMYRGFLFPRKFYELDGEGIARHINISTGAIERGVFYVDNGFWDTYRTVYPFLSLIDAKLFGEMTEGFYNVYRDTGWLPRWLSPDEFACMPGTLIEAVFADAVVKNIVTTELAEKMLEAAIANAETDNDDPRFGRKAVSCYRKLGYVPNDVRESVNETLDCCYGDYCISQMAKTLGKAELAEKYGAYAKNYVNIFDADCGFMRSRDEEGNFRAEKFNPIAWGGDYTEGSAWHSSFAVYHDIRGLNTLYGGKFADKMDELFATPPDFEVGGYRQTIHEMSEMAAIKDFGQCAICNQPSFHLPYIFSQLGDVDKTAFWVKKITDRAFSCSPDGFPGDEDNGTMACWYVFSMLGFYPFCPGDGLFTMSKPVVKSAKIKLWNGNVLTVNASDFDGKSVANTVSYFDLLKGGNLYEKVKTPSEN